MLKSSLLIATVLILNVLNCPACECEAERIAPGELVGAVTVSFQMLDMDHGRQHLFLCVRTKQKFASNANLKFTYSIHENRISVTLTEIYFTKAVSKWLPPKAPEPAEAAIDLSNAIVESKYDPTVTAPGEPYTPFFSSTLKSGSFDIAIHEANHGSKSVHYTRLAAFRLLTDAKGLTIEENAAQKRDNTASTATFAAREYAFDGKKLSEGTHEK